MEQINSYGESETSKLIYIIAQIHAKNVIKKNNANNGKLFSTKHMMIQVIQSIRYSNTDFKMNK